MERLRQFRNFRLGAPVETTPSKPTTKKAVEKKPAGRSKVKAEKKSARKPEVKRGKSTSAEKPKPQAKKTVKTERTLVSQQKRTVAGASAAALVAALAGFGAGAAIATGYVSYIIGNNSNENGAATTTLPTPPEDTTTTEVPATTTTEGQSTQENQGTSNLTETINAIFKAEGALAYPDIMIPDSSREPVFPDIPKGERPALVAYERPYEDGDYFEDAHGDIDLPQYNYRVMTAGKIKIDALGVDCESTDEKGCLVILVNHFGETATFRNAIVDNGFTIAGRVFDMSTPEKVTETGQALLDHYNGRMTESEDGANCGTIGACKEVEYHFVIVGNGQPQAHWTGIYTRP